MPGRLQDEIKQTRPFGTAEEEAFLNVVRTADALMRGEAALLKRRSLSPTQYNVLRILRGAGPAGLRCGEVAARMVTRDPDVTRLLDRLERRGVIARARDPQDRRAVTVRITPKGTALLAALEEPLADLHRRQLGHLGRRTLTSLIGLLERARSRVLERP